MVLCSSTIGIGLIVLAVGGGGGFSLAGFKGMTMGGTLAGIILVLGVFGVGC